MRLFILLCLSFVNLGSFSQTNAVKAYVISMKGDTIRGEAMINPKKPVLIYDKVTFKDLNGVQKNYKPDKIKGFGLGTENFMSYTYDGEPKFYKVLARGAINLYEISFEVLQGKEVLYESEFFLSYPDNKKLILVKQNKFKKQLADWMKDKPEIAENYMEDKEFDSVKALGAIVEYNSWKATQ